jgi:hypothetical protein
MVGADPRAERICPVTVRVDALSVSEKQGLLSEKGMADCRLTFSFPVSADSTVVSSVSAAHEAGSGLDVTSSVEGLLYQCVRDCTSQFLSDSYDPTSSRFYVDRADATAAADAGLIVGSAGNTGGPPSLARGENAGVPENLGKGSWGQWGLFYHRFTNDTMKDAYGGGFGITYMKGQNITENLGWGLEIGLLASRGTPVERATSTWTVDSSSLFMLDVPINASLVYPTPGTSEASFRPYLGIGGGGLVGLESMKAELSRPGSGVEVSNGVFRSAWTGELFCGAEFGQGGTSPFIETRFVVSGRTKVSEGLSAEEEQERAETLYDALVRPDGRVTGVEIYAGLRW